MINKSAFIGFVALLLATCQLPKKNVSIIGTVDPYSYKSQKKILATNGAVVSAHPLASKVGVEILKVGGNAFDAAIATQLALAVVFPNAGNLGGGGFMVARLADGQLISLDYREMAPGKAHRDMYIDSNGVAQTSKSQNGHLSPGVPGTIAGLFATMKYAKLSFDKLIQPAIDLAEKGYVITGREAKSFNYIQEDLKMYNTRPTVFQKSNTWIEGDTLVQSDLANTLKRIRDQGEKGFYEGKTAELIVEEMERGGGILTFDDLKNYKAKARAPHSFNYRNYKVVSMPMPSSGGILLHQMLKMIENKPLHSYGFHSTRAVVLMTEVERRAFADRAEFLGDADFYKVPVEILVSDKYLEQRMKDFDSTKAGNSNDIKPGKISIKESEQTTHLNVIDANGNAVAVTTTLNNSYGSKIVVGGGGFFLNNEMDDFSIKPGVPNFYGAIGGEANAIMPGKRMLSSMTPTLILKDELPFLLVGTPGGTTIPTSVFQTIVNVIDFGLSTEDAVNHPKFHHQWLPDTLDIEKGFSQTIINDLEKAGYKIKIVNGIGRTEVIKVLKDGRFEAVADKRGDDAAEGY